MWARRPVGRGRADSDTVDQPLRKETCRQCDRLFAICPACDRGHAYCSARCPTLARRRSVQAAKAAIGAVRKDVSVRSTHVSFGVNVRCHPVRRNRDPRG